MFIYEQGLKSIFGKLTDEVVPLHVIHLFLNQLLFYLTLFKLHVHVYVSVCEDVHMWADAQKGQRCGIPLELELLAVLCCLIWVLGVKPRSSGRAVHALNHWAISLALSFVLRQVFFSVVT